MDVKCARPRCNFSRPGTGEAPIAVPSAPSSTPFRNLEPTIKGGQDAREASGEDPSRTQAWVKRLRVIETETRAAEDADRNDSRVPMHPMRVYRELREVLDRNAIVIGDGGDFVSYAGRVIDSYEPGCWMDPGPYGCLGAGPGQAIGARIAHPDRQIALLLGDGAFGFSGLEFDDDSLDD